MHRLLVWFTLFILTLPAFGADIVVYDDTSHKPPFDQACSFGGVASDFDFANIAPVHTGSYSIRFVPELYNAVSWCGSTVYSTASYSAITFWVYLGNATQGDSVDFILSSGDTVNAFASLNTIHGAPIPVGVWTQLHTPFTSGPLNYTGSFDHLSFQDETGVANKDLFGNGFDAAVPLADVYFDDVVLQSAATVTYSVTASAPGGNGSISPPSQVVASGKTATFTVAPNTGYHVTSVTGDHCTVTQQGATTTWLSNAITQNCAVTAAFAINTYTVTPSAGAGGSLTPSTPQTVNYNATTNFTVGANAHYHVVSVSGCGGALVASTYTTAAITANCTVTATFAINTYTLTYNHDANGTITGTTPQTVNYGANGTAVTAVPNPSYHFAQWSDATTANPRTDNNVQANITVTAQFASDAPPPACGLTDHHDQSVIPAAGDTMISDVFDWCDSAGNPREAVLAHNNQTGKQAVGGYPNHGGSLQQFTYQMPGGASRTATITTYGNGGYGGFGYVVSHSAWLSDGYCSGDDSPLGYSFSGTWTRVFEGRHHAIFRFQQNYQRHCGPNPSPPTTLIPVTIDWVFSTARDNPLWAITYDLSAATANGNPIAADFLFDDSRAPYGELNIDGDGFSHDIDGVAWGDDYKFTSTTAPVTLSSAWTWNVANTIPYVKEWIVASNATMGLVQTQTITQQDAGGGRNPYYQDLTAYWGKTSAAGNACPSGGYSMPCQDGWPYQANNDSIGIAPNSNNNARLTWGTQYGFLGQTSYSSNQTKAAHPDDGPYLSGWPKKSYSVYVVLGPHTATPVETQVTQVETVQSLTLSATTGSVITSGPAGVNRADTVTYDPPGYDQIYGALAFNAASNVLDANIAVGSGTLKKPLIIVHNYTSASYPASVKLNGTMLTMDTDYFPSLRGNSSNELWITLDKDLSGATNHLEINTSSAAAAHWVDGYHVGYESGDLPINQVNFSDVTHLMIGAILPNTDGTLDTTFYIDAVNGPAWAQSAVTAAHTAGRKAILMIGGAGSITGWRGAASAANLNTFVTNLSNAATAYGADGLDIDWEPTTDNNASNAQIGTDHTELANLVQALHTARPDLLLTMPVGAYNPNYAPNISEQSLFTTITPLLDQINLMSYSMAYDYPGWYSWFASALTDEAPNTPLSVSSSIAYYQGLGVPNSKLGVGIGFYGICYNNVSQPRQDLAASGGYIANGDDNTMTYKHIASAYIPNMAYAYDATAKAPWLAHATAVAPEGCTYVTYENATSIADKGAWVSANGLGGTIIWTLAKGHLGDGNDPLLDAAHAAFP